MNLSSNKSPFNQYYTKSVPNPDILIILLPKNDKIVVLANILFLTIFPINVNQLHSNGGADFRPRIFFKPDCHYMFKSQFCNLHEVSYKIWKYNQFQRGPFFALNAHSPLILDWNLFSGNKVWSESYNEVWYLADMEVLGILNWQCFLTKM